MSDSKFRISLRENGEHSFKKSLELYGEYDKTKDQMLLKDTVLFLHNGIELLMKEMLVLKSEYLIFEDLKIAKRKQKEARERGVGIFFLDDPPRSVTYEEACERVEAFINPPELDSTLVKYLKKLNSLRNQLEHYAIDADKEEVVQLLQAIHKPILFLFENYLGSLTQLQTPKVKKAWESIDNTFETYMQKLQEVHQLMVNFNGQTVPGSLFGTDHDVVLPNFNRIYDNYILPMKQNDNTHRSFEYDIEAEHVDSTLIKSGARWVVEIKLQTPPARVVDMMAIRGFLANAVPWLVVFDKVTKESLDKAKKSKLMITDLDNFETLKQLIMSTN